MKLSDQLEALSRRHREPWRIDEEPHPYNDGTKHFTHVRYTARLDSDPLDVEVARYVTPDLAELLCALHNNLPDIIKALRAQGL
jgi:hypothetical protein